RVPDRRGAPRARIPAGLASATLAELPPVARCQAVPTRPPSSRGLGRHPFKVEIRGSNPLGGTRTVFSKNGQARGSPYDRVKPRRHISGRHGSRISSGNVWYHLWFERFAKPARWLQGALV